MSISGILPPLRQGRTGPRTAPRVRIAVPAVFGLTSRIAYRTLLMRMDDRILGAGDRPSARRILRRAEVPTPFRISPGLLGWLEADVNAWLDDRRHRGQQRPGEALAWNPPFSAESEECTPVKLAHLVELRSTLAATYVRRAARLPHWTNASPAAGQDLRVDKRGEGFQS